MTIKTWLGPKSQEAILSYVKAIQQKNKKNTEFRDKLEAMDEAYYRASVSHAEAQRASTCGEEGSSVKDLEVPLVLSEVDSITSFLADVYLSQYPLFPVLSTGEDADLAKALSAKIDEQATIGRWGRQLLLMFKNAARYNICQLECSWEPIMSASLDTMEGTSGEAEVSLETMYINTLSSLDPYNSFWDMRLPPAEVISKGEFAGYNELMNKPQLKELINTLGEQKEVINAREALHSKCTNLKDYYNERPIVSEYITSPESISGHSWLDWAKNEAGGKKAREPIDYSDNYLVTKVYARILPMEFDLRVPKRQHPQIWKFIIVNMEHVIHAKRVLSPYNFLPIMLGDMQEDGYGTQTQSIAENVLPYQDAATELLNIRLLSARRALGDRGIYNPKLVTKANINAPGATAKIPIKETNYREGMKLSDAYQPIPFDHNSTAGTIGDMNSVIATAERMNANNSARQGQFRQGNRTLGEFNAVMGNATSRQRTSVILLEHQVFIPLKAMLRFNLLRYASDGLVLTQDQNPQQLQFDTKKLRKAMLTFKVADGHTPKEQLMDPTLLQAALQTLPAIPELNAEYSTGDIFAQMLWLAGNVDIKQFRRQQPLMPQQGDPNAPQPQQPT